MTKQSSTMKQSMVYSVLAQVVQSSKSCTLLVIIEAKGPQFLSGRKLQLMEGWVYDSLLETSPCLLKAPEAFDLALASCWNQDASRAITEFCLI
ncbi:hypothetical protein HHK36_028485 [Tetracentron sinense]|uniref:Uncharacterized protein n=1 Tax=Tetracentron sinense TaxID=13715 RepID=A0A834YB53_TETSI|nr:hypothetical protein HHK36_028485 [Tetracentron sinense]